MLKVRQENNPSLSLPCFSLPVIQRPLLEFFPDFFIFLHLVADVEAPLLCAMH